VRADALSVVVDFDPARPHTVTGAALACRRLNEAVFPSHAEPANHATWELLYAVGSDTGSRRFERRVSGHTLAAQRLPGGELLRFSIGGR
jgi:hypothetical protein